jgi:hypothetical protein
MNKRVLNNWAPFTVIPAGEFKNPKGEMEEFYYVVLKTPGFQTLEHFEGTLQECREECHELNIRIGASLSQHIKDESKTPDSVTLDPWGSLMGRNKKEMMIAIPATKKPSNICPGCCYSDGRENREDGNWICHRCGDSGENEI